MGVYFSAHLHLYNSKVTWFCDRKATVYTFYKWLIGYSGFQILMEQLID